MSVRQKIFLRNRSEPLLVKNKRVATITGGGSFLLRKNGPGAASSYNQNNAGGMGLGMGLGMGIGMASLEKLEMKQKGKKIKNIQF